LTSCNQYITSHDQLNSTLVHAVANQTFLRQRFDVVNQTLSTCFANYSRLTQDFDHLNTNLILAVANQTLLLQHVDIANQTLNTCFANYSNLTKDFVFLQNSFSNLVANQTFLRRHLLVVNQTCDTYSANYSILTKNLDSLQNSFNYLVQTNKRLNTTCRRNTILYQQNITRCSRKLKASINQTVIIQKTALEQQQNMTQCSSDLKSLLAQTISLQSNNTILQNEITAMNKTLQNCSTIQSLSVNSRDTKVSSTEKKNNRHVLRSIADQLQWVAENIQRQNFLLHKNNAEYQHNTPR
jgi:hypothetical protein